MPLLRTRAFAAADDELRSDVEPSTYTLDRSFRLPDRRSGGEVYFLMRPAVSIRDVWDEGCPQSYGVPPIMALQPKVISMQSNSGWWVERRYGSSR